MAARVNVAEVDVVVHAGAANQRISAAEGPPVPQPTLPKKKLMPIDGP